MEAACRLERRRVATELLTLGFEDDAVLSAWLGNRGAAAALDVNDVLTAMEGVELALRVVLLRGEILDVLTQLLLLKDSPRGGDVRILTVLTAGDDEQVAACIRGGAFYCFLEPVDQEFLSSMLGFAQNARDAAALETTRRNGVGKYFREVMLTLKTRTEAEEVGAVVADLCPQPARQALGISELLLNAIEHGNLEIDGSEKQRLLSEGTYMDEVTRRGSDPRFADRVVTVWVRRHPDHVEIVVEDEGPGFDWKAFTRECAGEDDFSRAHGRGLALARALSFDSLELYGRGNVAIARAKLERRGREDNWSARMSSWEREMLEALTDSVADRVTEPSFFEAVLALASHVTDAQHGFFGYLDEAHDLMVPAWAPAPDADALDGALTSSSDGTPVTPCFPRRTWAGTYADAMLERKTKIDQEEASAYASIATPLLHGGELLGVIFVQRAQPFETHEARRLEVVARRMSAVVAARISAERAAAQRAVVERIEAERKKEDALAHHIVSSMLREGCLDAPGVRYHCSAVDLFNGDLALAAKLPDGGLRWMLGDFVGHGLPAAIGGLPLAAIFYATTRKGIPLEEVVATMNNELLDKLPRGLFCGLVLLEVSGGGHSLRCWNGGMPSALVRSWNSDRVRELTSNHLPLGVVSTRELEIQIETLEVEEHDRVICFSDGLIETRDENGELFGVERAARAIRTCTAPESFDVLLGAVEAFRGGVPAADDLSIIEATIGSPGYWLL